MALSDFGLIVARYNSSTPTLSTDNDIRELRLDEGSRCYVTLADDRDYRPRFWPDGAAQDGTPDNDKGIGVMGFDDANDVYKFLRLDPDGALYVNTEAGGTDVSEAADKANANDGQVDLTAPSPALTWVLIQSKAFAAGTEMLIHGWSYGSDKNAMFQLAICDDTGQDNPERSDITEILDTHLTTSARPSEHENFTGVIRRAGGADIYLCVFAQQLQKGQAGIAFSSINMQTT